jgi:hypothetical protein
MRGAVLLGGAGTQTGLTRSSGGLTWTVGECLTRARYPISGTGIPWGPVRVTRRGCGELECDVEVRCVGWCGGPNRPAQPLGRVNMDHVRVSSARVVLASSGAFVMVALPCSHADIWGVVGCLAEIVVRRGHHDAKRGAQVHILAHTIPGVEAAKKTWV